MRVIPITSELILCEVLITPCPTIPWGQLCIIIAYLQQKLRTVNLHVHCVLQFETNLLKWI